MISIKIIDSARFIKMPSSTQALYFHLISRADDDGIVEAFNVMRMTGSTEDDLKILVAKGFVIVLNEDLVSFISDWQEHNKIRADRKVDSIYQDLLLKVLPEVQLLESRERADRLGTSHGQPEDGIGKDRLGKDSIVEDSIETYEVIEEEPKPTKRNNWLLLDYMSQELNQTYKDFIAMRKSKKKELTERSLKMLIKKVNELSKDESIQIKILEQSIFNSWQGVFALKGGDNNGQPKQEYDVSSNNTGFKMLT